MKYTVVDKYNKIWVEINRLKKEPFDLDKCWEHPSYFTQHFLGITPYRYQHLILRGFRDGKVPKRIIICKSRQIGISYCLAFLAIWYVVTNKAGTGPHGDTKVGIISRSDDQAKKLMALIQKLIWNSPKGIADILPKNRRTPLSKKEIHFKKGFIKCFAPTDACRGETFDLLVVDEAAFVDGETFTDAMEPTVSAVDGSIILSSTPNGQKGFFFELFDPDDLKSKREYKRYWFYWKMCENEIQRKLIKQKFSYAKSSGNIKSFDQEYNALFTVDEEAFFEDQDVEKGLDKNLTKMYEWKKTPCAVAIDYGFVSSATCITVVAQLKDTIQVLYQFAQVGFDENLLMDKNWEHSIPNLFKRYNVTQLVTDNCPMGGRTNQQLENEGYPLMRFDFRSDQFIGERNRGYYLFRTALKHDKIKYPEFRNLMSEMKSIQEVRMEGGKYMKIKAPRSYSDDRCFVAGTRVLTDLGQIPIAKLNIGDKVLTREGYKRILKIFHNKVNREKLITRFNITGTKDHPFITTEGIETFINLNESHTLYKWNEKQLFIEELNITDIQSLNQGIQGSITGVTNMVTPQKHCIDKSGKTTLVTFLKDISSTIKRGILQIIPLKILNVFLIKNMPENIQLKNSNKNGEKILIKQDPKQSNGINQKKVWNGIKNIIKILLRKLKNINIFALSVKKNLKVQESQEQDIVQKNAEEKDFVNVFNLSVEDCNEYFVNNILVHNCDSLMMACYPFLAEEGHFSSTVVDYEKAMRKIQKDFKKQNARADLQWADLQNKYGGIK